MTDNPKDSSTTAPTLTPSEAVMRVLTHIERQAGRTDSSAAYNGLVVVPDLPLDALGDLGPLSRLDDASAVGTLPSLLLEPGTGGQIQIEICPFGPLALLSSDGSADTDPAAQVLYDAGLYPLFPADLDSAAPWHGHPLTRWLFPRRLSAALELFETLRG